MKSFAAIALFGLASAIKVKMDEPDAPTMEEEDKPDVMELVFALADSNGDGTLDEDELVDSAVYVTNLMSEKYQEEWMEGDGLAWIE